MKNIVAIRYLLFVFLLAYACSADESILSDEIENNSDSGNSSGQPGSASLKKGSFFLTSRFFYASENVSSTMMQINQPDGSQREIPIFGDPDTSIKVNALGDQQVLFYDYYAPKKASPELNQYTVIFYHGGGFQSGAANDLCTAYHLEEWLEMGFHGLIIGYRKGWFGDGSISPGGEAEISTLESKQFEVAAEMALEDAQQAWQHYNTNSTGHGRWFSGQTMSQVNVDHKISTPKYIVMGNSAGGSLVTRTVHTHAYPSADIEVYGAIVGFGTHSISEPILESHKNVPTIVVGGLFDDISPFYTNHVFYDSDMPLTKGTFNFYEELVENGYMARMLISAQKGHGWASFGKNLAGIACLKSVPDFIKDPLLSNIASMSDHYAVSFFLKSGTATNYQHFRFFKSAKFEGGVGFPAVDDSASIYEQIGKNALQRANVLTIDPNLLGLDMSDHLFINGFNYGNDSENGLGELNVLEGFRYEPFQTEFERALENENKPSDIKTKYNF